MPGIGRYVQNHLIEPIGDGVDSGFDGFSERWFENRAAFDLTMPSNEWDEMNTDALDLFNHPWIISGWSALIDALVVKT